MQLLVLFLLLLLNLVAAIVCVAAGKWIPALVSTAVLGFLAGLLLAELEGR